MTVQTSLFDEPVAAPCLDLVGADLRFVPQLFDEVASHRLFADLQDNCAWRQDTVQMYGRRVLVPRLVAWYGERRAAYSYSGLRLEPTPWLPPLLEIKAAVEAEVGTRFNSVLANLYRDGRDSVAWHADDETELGREPIIASVTLGATRTFGLRHAADHSRRHHIDLPAGSLLVMGGTTQRHWQHRIAKTAKPVGPRINLTFRLITPSGGAWSQAPKATS